MIKTIAVDFDGTLCRSAWPDIGAPVWPVIRELVRQQREEGAKVILWTCRSGEQLDAAVAWCMEHGLRLDAVNDNLPEHAAYFGGNSRKVYANEYWDDKNVLVRSTDRTTGLYSPTREGGLSAKVWNSKTEVRFDQARPQTKRWWQFWRSA